MGASRMLKCNANTVLTSSLYSRSLTVNGDKWDFHSHIEWIEYVIRHDELQ